MTVEMQALRSAVAELLGFEEDWPAHGNAALAIASVVAIQSRALRSIAANTCCDGCREAALVAQGAVFGWSYGGPDERSPTELGELLERPSE